MRVTVPSDSVNDVVGPHRGSPGSGACGPGRPAEGVGRGADSGDAEHLIHELHLSLVEYQHDSVSPWWSLLGRSVFRPRPSIGWQVGPMTFLPPDVIPALRAGEAGPPAAASPTVCSAAP